MSRKAMFFSPQGGSLLSEAAHIFALHNFYGNWDKAVMLLERTSDNALKYVFFDGDEITLSSKVGDATDTPSVTTLGTWIGANTANVRIWYAMNDSNTIDISESQINIANQPVFISSGTINTKNSNTSIDFTSATRFLADTAITELDSGNSFSVFTVSSNNVSSGIGSVFCTTSNLSDRLSLFNDSRTNKVITTLFNGTTTYNDFLIAQQNTTNQKLLSITVTSTDMDGYFNGVSQDTVSWSGAYTNDNFRIGNQFSNNTPLDGDIQFIAIFDTDRTTDIGDIQTEINNYFSIY